MRRAAAGWLMAIVGLAATSASAQIIESATLDRDQFGRLDCEVGAESVLLNVDTDAAAVGGGRSLRAVFFRGVSTTAGTLQCDAARAGTTIFRGTEVTSVIEPIELPPVRLLGDPACEEPGERVGDAALCLFLDDSLGRAIDSLGVPVAFDTQAPEQPEIQNLRGGDGRISFDVGNVVDQFGDVYEFLVQYRPCEVIADADGGTPTGDAGSAGVEAESICDAPGDFSQVVEQNGDIAIGGLTNGVEYEVRVIVRDDFGNESQPSEAVTATPQAGLGPLDFYNGSGSPYSFAPSCGAAKGGSVTLLGLLGLLGFVGFARGRRRDRRSPTRPSAWLSLALLPALLASAPSAAQTPWVSDLRDGEVTLSLFAGPYHPGIDNEQRDGADIFPIYGCFFDDATLVEIGASLDYHLLDIFGSLQLGLGLNATQAKGNALPPSAAGTNACGEKTDDSVELTILKVKPQLTYRLDPLLDYFGFPLVPYGRVGVVGAGYAFTSGGLYPDAPTEAQNPMGLVLGWEAAGGLMLALDFWDYLDPFSRWGTKRARSHGLMNHAFVYGEALWQPLDNFGRPSLVLSPTDPFTGTTAPWTVHFGVAVELL